MDIEKEIENLIYQAKNNERTGYIELAQQQRQYVAWFKELLKYRKQDTDFVKSINHYHKAMCKITPDCEMCDAYDGKYCELGFKKFEEEK